jgi:fatty acid desaturase
MNNFLSNESTEVALKTADAGAVLTLAAYLWGLVPQITIFATLVWAIFRIWSEWENIKLKRAQRKLADETPRHDRRKEDRGGIA